MIKRPNTLKMHRLLQQLLECDPRNAKQVRELQDDTRKVLGLEDEAARKPLKRARR